MNYLYLIFGLIVLIGSGKFLVDSAVSIAQQFKISNLAIGVTIVSAGTSFPELIVSINAAINHNPDIAIGNVMGSNISNIALILGLSALIYPLSVNKISLKFDWPVLIFSIAVLFLFIYDKEIVFYEGIILLLILGLYFFFSLKSNKKNIPDESISQPAYSIFYSILIFIASSVGLYFGAEYLVKGASNIAYHYGLSDRVIAVSIIAVGTSLPELVTSIMAAIKKQPEISLGNILGSNIFNIAGILGITSIIKSIPVNNNTINLDFYWVLGTTLLLLTVMLPFRKIAQISRLEGLILFLVYISYIYLLFS